MNEPKGILNADRWATWRGPKFYPYVRSLGGVSLFDFHKFDPQDYQAKYPNSSWQEFVPYRRAWGGAVWIEIDRKRIPSNFLSGCELLNRRESAEDRGRVIMPLIEATYLGALPVAAFRRALFVSGTDGQFHEVKISGFSLPSYELLLDGWRKDCKNAEAAPIYSVRGSANSRSRYHPTEY